MQKWANEQANGAPIELRRELESIHESLQKSSRGWAAWRIEGTLREFRSFKPKNLWFEYPVHLPDETGALADLKCEGEYDPRASRSKGRDVKAKNDKTAQQVKIELISDAMEQCAEDGVDPTRKNLLERIGEFKGEEVTESQLKSWTGNASKWSPFRYDADAKVIYNMVNRAIPFEGEVDLTKCPSK